MRDKIEYWVYKLFAGIVLFMLLMLPFMHFRVVGSSMYPTLQDGDHVWGIAVFTPKRYDIVCADFRSGKDNLYIKRIVGVPGDYVSFSDRGLYINEELISTYYPTHHIEDYEGILDKDDYFLVGDNHTNSSDSRSYGTINVSQIRYKVISNTTMICYMIFMWIIIIGLDISLHTILKHIFKEE